MARRRENRSSSAASKLLIVEGSSDANVISALAKVGDLDRDFEIKEQRGILQVISAVRAYWSQSGIQVLGMVVDADENALQQWNIIRQTLGGDPVFAPLKDQPDSTGTVLPGRPRLGIWIMPDNSNAGELEDFIAKMIPEPDPVWPRAVDFIAGIPEADRKFPAHKAPRATVHAWLATRSRPRPMWAGIGDGDLKLEANSQAFLNWMRRLFGVDIPPA